MTLIQNQVVTTIPNVLSDQTVPNTLSGVGQPGKGVREPWGPGWPRSAAIVTVAVVVAVLLAIRALTV